MQKAIVIGAGPAGATLARTLAEANFKIQLFDKREHIAGNCYDEYDQYGVQIHRYGPHYFRTNSQLLVQWLSQFTDWIEGQYYVTAKVGDKFVPMPVSLATISQLKDQEYSVDDFKSYLESKREIFKIPQNAEEQCLSSVGRELYELLFKGYTEKQWGVPPVQLDPSITARIPLRFNHDLRYPKEKYQIYPKLGYTALFEKLLDHPNITKEIGLKISSQDIQSLRRHHQLIIYTGPIDEYFDYCFGRLGYRSLQFEWKNYDCEYMQKNVQINYPNDFDYTRTVEIKHVSQQEHPNTTLCYEYPSSHGDPYYPLLNPENIQRYKKYAELAHRETLANCPVYFIGRMAEYRYYNMDQVFLKALQLAKKITGENSWKN